MAEKTVCNVCQQEITDPAEAAKKRYYKVKATGYCLPPQKKHDLCDAEYAAEKVGLEAISETEAMAIFSKMAPPARARFARETQPLRRPMVPPPGASKNELFPVAEPMRRPPMRRLPE